MFLGLLKFSLLHNKFLGRSKLSNGKSSIVEEWLNSFFFALLKKTKLCSFSFFLFFTINNEEVCFASILYNFKRFPFVLICFRKFLEYTNSFYLRLWKNWENSLRFTLLCQILEQPNCFCFVLAKLKTKPNCFRFDL